MSNCGIFFEDFVKGICKGKKGDLDVSENSGTPKSSILIGSSAVNHPFWGFSMLGDFEVNWLVVEPTPLKNMLVKLDHFPR